MSAETARIQAKHISNQLMITTGVVRESSEAASRGAEMITKVAKETSAKNARQWQKQGAKITALTVIMALFAPLNLMTSVGFSSTFLYQV